MPRHSRYGEPHRAVNAEQLFQSAPASGRDVDIANFFIRRVNGEVGPDDLADLLAAYRIETEEKLEEKISDLQDEVDQLQDELSDYTE